MILRKSLEKRVRTPIPQRIGEGLVGKMNHVVRLGERRAAMLHKSPLVFTSASGCRRRFMDVEYHPDRFLLDPPSALYELLPKHYEVAREIGLNYVYVENVPGNPYSYTYCPGCERAVIKRYGFTITEWNLDDKYD